MDATLIKNFLNTTAKVMMEEKDHLIEADSIVGDGDLGLTMSDGFTAASDAIKENPIQDCGKLLYAAGKAMSTAVPSTMGTLMASGLMSAGKALKGKTELTREDILSLFDAFLSGVIHLGKAKQGEKTFIDGFAPGCDALHATADVQLKESAKAAADASMKGYLGTKGMLAIHGRAATRGEASRALLDPGAYVGALLFKGFYLSLE